MADRKKMTFPDDADFAALADQTESGSGLPVPKGPPAYAKKANREGCVMLGVWIPIAARKQLKLLATERDTTMEELTLIALNDLFAKCLKPQIKK